MMQQAITWTNVGQVLLCHVASLVYNELNGSSYQFKILSNKKDTLKMSYKIPAELIWRKLSDTLLNLAIL